MNKTLIIAEAGVNHNGSLERATEMIITAKKAGVDIVKFQTFKAQNLVTQTAEMAQYQKTNTGQNQSQYAMLKEIELSEKDFIQLKNVCDSEGVEFLSTAFDFESLEFLKNLNMKRWKIPSGELTNLPYIEWIARQNVPVIFSTGMASIEEILEIKNVLISNGLKEDMITVLHCTTEYPAPLNSINLKAMNTIKEKTGLQIGYSDHSMGVSIPVAAVALGARVIEKHFTLSRTLPGPDHVASLEPDELKQMVDLIREVEIGLGSSEKKISDIELKNRLVARKSIVAARDIVKGQVITEYDITTKRPGTGLSPMKWHSVIGSLAKKNYSKDDLFEDN